MRDCATGRGFNCYVNPDNRQLCTNDSQSAGLGNFNRQSITDNLHIQTNDGQSAGLRNFNRQSIADNLQLYLLNRQLHF